MRRAPVASAAVAVTALLAAACAVPTVSARATDPSRSGLESRVQAAAAPETPSPRTQPRRPNVVLVLMDDFSMDLLPTLRSAQVMAQRGASYDHSFVVDSLCCVSRSAIFTGQYPHQTGVRTNTATLAGRSAPVGGWAAFAHYGNPRRTFAVRLQRAGYVTGFVGKYLNGYEVDARRQRLPRVPPGWTDFRAIFGTAYDGWDFQGTRTTADGKVVLRSWPAPPRSAPRKVRDRAYAGTVIGDLALRFLRKHQDDDRPYFLEVAPYAPHSRVDDDPAYAGERLFPAAFRDQPRAGAPRGNCGAVDCRDLTVADLPGFGDGQRDNRPVRADRGPARAWNAEPQGLTRPQAQTNLRDRARMAQSVDRMLLRILRLVDDDTYVVLTSDNGFHLGQHGLLRGKGTAYDSDTRVPLLVVGPGVVPGTRDTMVSNLDLAPTFEALAGLQPAAYRSGISLVASFTDPAARLQEYVFFEHTSSAARPGLDPDRPFTGGGLNVIPSYVAVRSPTALLVRNDLDPRWGHERYAYEFYDYAAQAAQAAQAAPGRPWERVNQFGDPAYAGEVATLMAKLREFDACSSVRGDEAVPERCRGLTLG